MRKKAISSLLVNGQTITDQHLILQAFTDFYSTLLGKSSSVYPCCLQNLYDERPLLHELESSFSVTEIKLAVSSLANNKASGPDGIPNEFAKIKWDMLKFDILEIFEDLFHGTIDLQSHNFAHITLLPKTSDAIELTSFRPISILNYIPKLISKVLANRLGTHIPDLICTNQSGFVKGRLIHENFLCAREIVVHLTKCKEPAFLLKLDFFKAFDTVNWVFLLNVLKTFGLPQRFICWIEMLLNTATSAVLINNQVGPTFRHAQGLRQGDPISPFLFIMVADVLTKMCETIGTSSNVTISSKLRSPFHILQYADDTIIFSSTKGNTVRALKMALTLFSLCSGLNLNLHKSTFVPLNLTAQQTQQVQQIIGCGFSPLPLPYLGLPLTASRPPRDVFLHLIEKVESKLAGWKNKLLSRAGRLTLVCSVLSSIPIFFMSVFKLPSWVIKSLDKLRRSFLWGRSGSSNRGFSLLAWDRVCLPKKLGGFGVLNLKVLNMSLLLRWLWRIFDRPSSQWSTIAKSLIASRYQQAPLGWSTHGSFFWKDLLELRHVFSISTSVTIGDGNRTLFWYANWGNGYLHFFNNLSKPVTPKLTVRKVLLEPETSLQAPWSREVHDAVLLLHTGQVNQELDVVNWKWNASGTFTVSSAYQMLIAGGKTNFPAFTIWKLKLPFSVKLFAVLLFHNRLLTQEALHKRNIMVQPGCVLCSSANLETAPHLFSICPFAVQIWQKLKLLFPPLSAAYLGDLQSLWEHFLQYSCSGRDNNLAILTLTALWAIWLERNNRIFKQQRRTVDSISHWIVTQHSLFLKHC
ncbi:RNA-directed DNA polymerase (reverse transcriptase)-related family protein [Rhynchospora pubera]|uniref:RNA-directed DNA polymerase (Reverse transcriptase)-related family protein n=1 Tax=Rhynchospora pubera TaxID=906938 RepID=A0AAV8DTS8_9POAL|nr:RNA-directed DNA polymerase (reverse transcriptase)-related family protein [Rhynchospora pubera]